MSTEEEKPEVEAPAEESAEATNGGTEAAAAAGDEPTTGHSRIFVGNLAWEVSWQDLKDLMASTGHEVTHADIMTTQDGRSKGCGIVEFATPEGAQEAMTNLMDFELKGRKIFLREDREDRGKHRHSSGEQAQSRRVYVGNLSWDVAWPDLKDHMKQAGDVVHAEVIAERNGRSKGCGIVEYKTEEEAKQAIDTLSQTELNGRMIFVREDRETAGGGASGGTGDSENASVFVANLSYDTTWQDVKDHMRLAGNVDSATLLESSTGMSKGAAVVTFQRPQDAARAIRELSNSELQGRTIRVRENRGNSGRGGGGGGNRNRGGPSSYGGSGGEGGGGAAAASKGRLLFVGNLSFDTAWTDLKDHFALCGNVERADVKSSRGRSRGFGTVLFGTEAEASKAIGQLNGVELHGRALEVRLDNRS